MDKPNYKVFTYAVSESNLKIYKETVDEIDKLLYKEEDIPFKLASDAIRLVMKVDYFKNDDLQKKVAEVISKAVRYFEKSPQKQYCFNGFASTPIYIDEDELFERYSLHNLFYQAVFEYYRNTFKSKVLERDNVIQFFYEKIKNYRDSKFTKEDIDRLTHYKLGVMAAYLAFLVGYLPTTKKRFTKKDLFQSSKNALNKLKET